MPAAIFLDQRESRTKSDLVQEWLERVNADPSLSFLLPFERTAGDEMQALTQDPQTLAEVARRALETQAWWLGVGVGQIDLPLPTSVRESHGEAFTLGRQAIEAAKSPRAPGLQVIAEEDDRARRFEDALILLNDIYEKRPSGAAEVARLRRKGLKAEEIAQRLGISRQAVSKHLKAARWREEGAAERITRHFAEELLR